MRSDMRGLTVSGGSATSLTAASTDIVTDWIDTATLVGPVAVIANVPANASLSGTLSLQHATSAAGAGSATVSDDDDFPGGRDAQGANATGGIDFAANNALDAALSYNGDRRYVRGHLRVARAGGNTVTAHCSVVAVGMPQVTPER